LGLGVRLNGRGRSRWRLACLEVQEIWGGVLLHKLHVKEDDDACDVIHDAFFLPFPPEVALPNDSLRCFFSIFRLVERLDDGCYFLVRDELPDSIAGDHHKLVIFA